MNRDEFAIEAMKILLSYRQYDKWKKYMKLYGMRTIPQTIAEISYSIADAMMKEK